MVRRALVLAALLCAVAPASAGAHATVTGTAPERGAQLGAPPGQVLFRFSETVQEGVVRVFDGRGAEVQAGGAFQPQSDQLAVRLPPGLADGGFTATYRAISADSHPVTGGFSFTVGEGGPGPQGVDRLLEGTQSGPVTATALGAARALQYAAITLAVGTLLFLALCTPAGAREAVAPRVARVLTVAAAAGVVASVAGLLLHGAQAAGTPVWDLELAFGTQFGVTWLLAIGAWLALAALRRSGWATLPAGLLCVVPASGGHASVEGPLMLGANLVHVVAIAGWIGGLAALLLVLRPGTRDVPDRQSVLKASVRSFSRLAGVLVAVVLGTGIVQSIVELSAWSELTATGYGRAILVKLGLFAVLLGFGAYHRRRDLPPLATLRAELGVAVVVLGVTGALATYAPGKASALGPFAESAALGPARMEFTLDPSAPGVNEAHVYLFDRQTGAQYDETEELTARATQGDLELALEFEKAGPGHYVARQATLPTPGDWTLRVEARISDFDQFAADLEVPVR